jgi:hypothetical protein
MHTKQLTDISSHGTRIYVINMDGRRLYMERQNVTLSLPKPLLRKAKAVATKAEKSLSALLREALEEKVNEESGYKKAKRSQLNLLKVGLDLGTEGHTMLPASLAHDRQSADRGVPPDPPPVRPSAKEERIDRKSVV